MIVVQREVLARLSKSERKKAEILVRWATELHGRRTHSSLADQRYASLAWALGELGVVTFVDVERQARTSAPGAVVDAEFIEESKGGAS